MIDDPDPHHSSRPRSEDRVHARAAHEFCERSAGGETVVEIPADPHRPTERGIYLALGRDEAFAAEYARAREGQLVRWEDEIVRIADDGSNDFMERQTQSGDTIEVVNHDHISRSKLWVDARKWLMSKRLPKRYGDRVAVDGDADAPPVRVEMTATEVARRVAFLLTKAAHEAEQGK